jgi:hypothetical protein
MSGRIRTVKPEWLEDELLVDCSSDARVLSIGLILLADDYGNGRAHVNGLTGKVFPCRDRKVAEQALAELVAIRFVTLYEVAGQHYFSIRNWKKHQRVDKPGRPTVPSPPVEGEEIREQSRTLANGSDKDFVYFIQEGDGGPVKIGRSFDPTGRLRKLATGSSKPLALLGVVEGGWQERDLHKQFSHLRVSDNSEWFNPGLDLLAFIRERSIKFANHSRTFATDLDLEMDQDQEGKGKERTARVASDSAGESGTFPASEPAPAPSLAERAGVWVSEPRDYQTASFSAPHPEKWPEVLNLERVKAEVFGCVPDEFRTATDERVLAALARYSEGYSPAQLASAVRGAGKDPGYREKPQWQNLATILKSAKNVDRFIALERAPEPEAKSGARQSEPLAPFAKSRERLAEARAHEAKAQ